MEIVYPILSFCGAVVGAVLFSYLHERGKNLATKNDIADITNRVESVKSLYSADQEKLKAQLNFLVTAQHNLQNDTKKAIFEFWEGTVLLTNLCDPLRNEVDEDRIHEIDQYMQEVHSASNELQMRQARLYLLVADREIIRLSDVMYKCATRMQGKFELYVVRAKPHIEEMVRVHKSALGTQEEYNSAWKKVQEFENMFDQEVAEFTQEMDEAMESFKQKSLLLLTAAIAI